MVNHLSHNAFPYQPNFGMKIVEGKDIKRKINALPIKREKKEAFLKGLKEFCEEITTETNGDTGAGIGYVGWDKRGFNLIVISRKLTVIMEKIGLKEQKGQNTAWRTHFSQIEFDKDSILGAKQDVKDVVFALEDIYERNTDKFGNILSGITPGKYVGGGNIKRFLDE